MKKELIFLAVLFLNIVTCFGQGFNNLLGGSGNDVFNAVIGTPDGDYIAIGTAASWGSGSNDVLAVKYSPTGSIIWSKTYGLPNVSEEGLKITTASSSNYMIAGTTTVMTTPYVENNRDLLLLEIDTDGQLIWSKSYSTTLSDRFKSIVPTSDGGYILCGDIWNGTNDSSPDYFMVKLNASRNIMWQKKFNYTQGGDLAAKVIPASDGGYFFAGGSYIGTSNKYDHVVVKFNSTGTAIWSKQMGGPGNDGAADIFEMANGEVIVAGNVRPAASDNNMRCSMVYLDNTGSLVWAKQYSAGEPNVMDATIATIRRTNNDFVFVGYTKTSTPASQQILAFKTDYLGNLIYSKSYGQPATNRLGSGHGIIETVGGDFVITGFSDYNISGLKDPHIIKTNNLGNINPEGTCNSAAFIEQELNFATFQDIILVYAEGSFASADITLNTTSFNSTPGITGNCNISECDFNKVNFSGLPTFICPNAPAITLMGSPSGGTFTIDAVSMPGGVLTPSSYTPGPKLITYTYPSLPPGCANSIAQKTLIAKPTKTVDRIISATSITYSDTWPTDYTNLTQIDLVDRNNLETGDEVRNGTKGIWRGEENYIYVEKRQQTTPGVKIMEDGIYNDMPLFNHASALNGGCTPKWRLVNTITEYNPFSNELENKDILNRRSAALFGYLGTLAVAVAANAREREIAYESFDEYEAGEPVLAYKLSSGNLSIYTNTDPPNSDFYTVYKPYEIITATDNVLTVDYPYNRISGWVGKKARITGSDLNVFNEKLTYGNYTITAVNAHATDVTKSMITLSATEFTHLGIWSGKISIPVNYATAPPAFTGVSNLSIVSAKKHTGKNSLKSTGNASFEQIMMDLIPGEDYMISAWVSADQPDYTYRVLSGPERRGFTLEFLDKNGGSLGTTNIDIDDKNPVIEGWQKIEGKFKYPNTPVNAEKLVLHFKSPSGTNTYWDDIRIFPFVGNIKTYVYDVEHLRVSAILDNNNYASFYYYDPQGNLFLIKKETERGVQTIQESYSHRKQ